MRIRLICSAVTCGLLLAACGGSSNTGGTRKSGPYGPRHSPYTLSKCMRENGLSHFPDPSQGPNGGGIGFPGGLFVASTGEITVDGITFSGPALRKASRACRAYLPPSGPPPKVSAAQEREGLQLARCMRAHGVPNFPDPGSLPGSGAAAKQVPLPDSNTPAFKHAARVCAHNGIIAVRG